MANVRDRFIELARSQVGTKEEGGENRVIYSEYFDTPRAEGGAWEWLNGKKNGIASWCAIFVLWLFCQLTNPDEALWFLGCPPPKDNCAASCSYLWKYLKALGWEVANGEGQPGDIIFFNTKKAKCGHVGIIESVDDKYHSIEGNKSDKVARGSYSKSSSSIYGIMRPAWAELEEAPEPTPQPEPTPEPAPAPAPQPEGKPYKVVNIKTNLRVRSGPGTNYPVVGYLKNGDAVTVYETSGSWARIGDNRWASLDYLAPASNNSGTRYKVTAKSGLRLRGGPGTNYVSLAVMPYGTILEVRSIANGWAYTSYSGYSGYCSSNYLTKA